MSHLKRIGAPKKWRIKRKEGKFIMKPSPGAHSLKEGISILMVFRDILGYAENLREVKYILNNNNISVDGKKTKDHKLLVGLFDVIEIKESKEAFRVISKNGKFSLTKIKTSEANLKTLKITGKNKIGKKTQLNFYDGKNMLVEKDEYKTGDSLLVELLELKVKDTFKLEKGNTIYLTGGKHINSVGTIEAVSGRKIQYKNKNGVFETLKKYAFVVGKDKPVITVKE